MVIILLVAGLCGAVSLFRFIYDKGDIQRAQVLALRSEEFRQSKESAIAPEKQRKTEEQFYQATEDINHLKYTIAQLNKKSEYLELERDACVPYGKEWHKWNDKVMANDERIYKLMKQMNKAKETAERAKRNLEGVA